MKIMCGLKFSRVLHFTCDLSRIYGNFCFEWHFEKNRKDKSEIVIEFPRKWHNVCHIGNYIQF